MTIAKIWGAFFFCETAEDAETAAIAAYRRAGFRCIGSGSAGVRVLQNAAGQQAWMTVAAV